MNLHVVRACVSRRQHKPGACPRKATKIGISPCNGRQRVVFETTANLALAVACFAGLGLFVCMTWGSRPRLYAFACWRRLLKSGCLYFTQKF